MVILMDLFLQWIDIQPKPTQRIFVGQLARIVWKHQHLPRWIWGLPWGSRTFSGDVAPLPSHLCWRFNNHIYNIMGMCGCQLALAEAQPAYVSLLPMLSSSCLCFASPPKKGARFRTQKWGRYSKIGTSASKFAVPFFGPWSGRPPFRKARVELRQWTLFINGFLRLVAKMVVSQ